MSTLGRTAEEVKWLPNGDAAAPSQAESGAQEAPDRQPTTPARPLILITEPPNAAGATRTRTSPGEPGRRPLASYGHQQGEQEGSAWRSAESAAGDVANGPLEDNERSKTTTTTTTTPDSKTTPTPGAGEHADEMFEEIDGIKYRIVAAVTKPQPVRKNNSCPLEASEQDEQVQDMKIKPAELERSASTGRRRNKDDDDGPSGAPGRSAPTSRLSSVRRKSSAFVSNLLHSMTASSSYELQNKDNHLDVRPRRMSIYEMTKSPPPETSIEHYLNERRRSSTVSASFVAQQLEQQSTFEQNYCQRQQYFKDLNEKLINQDRKLLNVVANRGQIQRHSVDIAQLPLEMAQAKGRQQAADNLAEVLAEEDEEEPPGGRSADEQEQDKLWRKQSQAATTTGSIIDQVPGDSQGADQPQKQQLQGHHLASISEHDQRKQANKLLVNNGK